MRSLLSAMVLAASFALLVPDNGAQAVNAAQASASGMAAAGSAMPAATAAASERGGAPEAPIDSDVAILLALGFLGAVMARRLRAD